ncbi:MAG: VOC family protein [Candidatus Hodarchaeales archaeon]|jgi:predicted enzyme related to lactoylglutathione lyase
MHNFVHVEIKVTNFDVAKEFYGNIFNWDVFTIPEMKNVAMYRVDKEAEEVGGAFFLVDKVPEESSILLYINAKDINSILSIIESKGGIIVLEKTELPGGHGFIGRFRDPFGNLMGLWSEE